MAVKSCNTCCSEAYLERERERERERGGGGGREGEGGGREGGVSVCVWKKREKRRGILN